MNMFLFQKIDMDWWIMNVIVVPFLWFLRFVLEIPAFYHKSWWWYGETILASDGIRLSKDISIQRHISYGPMTMQSMDKIVHRKKESSKKQNVKCAILYAHGGGGVVCRSEHTSHSVVPLIRGNQTFKIAFSVDYPYSPEHRSPCAVLSILQAAAFVKKNFGIERLIFAGESSGSQLVTVAAALIENKTTLHSLLDAVQAFGISDASCCALNPHNLRHCTFPKIVGVTSVSGILDREAWRCPPNLTDTTSPVLRCLFGLEWRFVQMAIDASLRMSRCCACLPDHDSKHARILRATTLSDLYALGGVSSYPPLFLVSAEHDPLKESSTYVRTIWKRDPRYGSTLGTVTCIEYGGQHHGFFGLPMQWTDFGHLFQYFVSKSFRERVLCRKVTPGIQLATNDMIHFIRSINKTH